MHVVFRAVHRYLVNYRKNLHVARAPLSNGIVSAEARTVPGGIRRVCSSAAKDRAGKTWPLKVALYRRLKFRQALLMADKADLVSLPFHSGIA